MVFHRDSVVKCIGIGNLGVSHSFARIAANLRKPSAEKSRFIGENAEQIDKIDRCFGETATRFAARESQS